MEELIKRSAPYLEYQDNEGFSTYKETFLIFPRTSEEEMRKWNRFTVPGRRFSFHGDTEGSPYQITTIQFHYGLPLYSIDEIEDWLKDYKEIHDSESRPVHKFHFRMKEPYINIAKSRIHYKEDIEELYNWAKEVSEQGLYPILTYVPGDEIFIINSDEDAAREFYFNLYDEVYLSIDKIQGFFNLNAAFKKEIKRIVHSIIVRTKEKLSSSQIIREFIVANDEKKDMLLNDILKEFVSAKIPDDENIKINDDGEIFISADSCPKIRPFLRAHFYLEKKIPEVKKGIDDDDIVNELFKNADFFAAFLRICDEACLHMREMGNLVPPPRPFDELISI